MAYDYADVTQVMQSITNSLAHLEVRKFEAACKRCWHFKVKSIERVDRDL